MKIRVREQAGTDAARKFDYQMAVALDCLLSEIDNDVIVLIETLEDFAVFRNPGTDIESIDIYQVKTKNRGLYSQNTLLTDNVIGKIILTDIYFDSKANSLNIVCNTNLKGRSTEAFDEFIFEETLTDKELLKLKDNVKAYLNENIDFKDNVDTYIGKLVYIKSPLPFAEKEDRYDEMLIGKTHKTIAHYLGDENHQINPTVVFNTLKILIDSRRRIKLATPEDELEKALFHKGIHTDNVKEIIDKAAEATYLTKKEIFQHAADIFPLSEFEEIKQEYPTFLSYKANLLDQAYIIAIEKVREEYLSLVKDRSLSIEDAIRKTALNCQTKISYYSLPIIQIISIIVAYS